MVLGACRCGYDLLYVKPDGVVRIVCSNCRQSERKCFCTLSGFDGEMRDG